MPWIFCSGQELPNGPRTPTTSPIFSRLAALDTLPAFRMVWMTRPCAVAMSELIEMAASPYPGTYSMLNWPGSQR